MAQAQTVAIPKRIQLVIDPENRGDTPDKDSRLINCYVETKKGPAENQHWIYERPGLEVDSRPPAADATGRGMYTWRGNVYSIFGDRLYKDGVVVAGTVDTTNGVYRFDSSLGATPKLQMGNGVEAYNYDSGAGLVNISDADFPASFVKGWAFLDSTTYVGTASSHLLGSDIGDPTAWDPLNDILAYIEPDLGVAVNKQLVYCVFLKQWSTEIFYDAGNSSGSPLGRVEGAKVNWGCLSADSVQRLDGALLWVGATFNGSPEVLLLDNLKVDTVSTGPIERILGIVDFSTETIYSWTIKTDGHRFYVLTCVTANITLVYDLEERLWSQWTDASGNYFPFVAATLSADGTQNLIQHASNGRIYCMDHTLNDDAGDLIQVDIYTPVFDGETRREKNCTMLEIICDRVVGATMQVRVNDADYLATKWTNFRDVDLGQSRPQLTDMGTFSRRAHNFRYKSAVRMPRVQAVDLQLDIGTL